MVLQQYEAVSFGDAVFGCYVLLPMQQQHSTRLRSAVWSEQSGILSALIVPLKQVHVPLISIVDFTSNKQERGTLNIDLHKFKREIRIRYILISRLFLPNFIALTKGSFTVDDGEFPCDSKNRFDKMVQKP